MKPDIIIPYPARECSFTDPGPRPAFAVAYVRPETNTVLYERAILAGLRAHGKIIYCANLPATVFERDKILERHYPSQFRFARDPFGELSRYPEIRSRMEEHFCVRRDKARVLGSFDAMSQLGISEERLLETIVPESDYLGCWGQSFKRIAGAIIVNPNLPAIVLRHKPPANVFAVVVRCADCSDKFFDEVNEAIFREITSRSETPIIDGEKLDALVWWERIRRTYHLSANHVMTMLDMSDFVYTGDAASLAVTDTPLGRWLIEEGAISAEKLAFLKSWPLARRRSAGLVYLPTAARGMTLDQIRTLMKDL
ncbi:MAG TPA: hypothetical protein VMU36_11590 [Spirochaetia bacterium]|nr:hypothetical protein [Spirochaetia bacterium]